MFSAPSLGYDTAFVIMVARRRLELIALLVLGMLCVPVCARAQRSPHVPRLGYLGLDVTMAPQRQAAFLDGLRALGYEEGRTIAIEYRWAEGRPDRLPALAAELVGLPWISW